MTKVIIYDLEVYPNFFSAIFYDYADEIYKKAVIFDGQNKFYNDLPLLVNILKQKAYFVGYNNTFYDNQILEYIYQHQMLLKEKTAKDICSEIYKLSSDIINNNQKDYMFSNNILHFDLMKIGGGDGLRKSLKSCMCNLKHNLIQDLPIHFSDTIKDEQVKELLNYNKNDVEGTVKLFDNLFNKISLRIEASKLFGINLLNETDSSIANRILENLYTKKTGKTAKDMSKHKIKRNKIPLKNVIFDNISFGSQVLQKFLEELREIVVDASGDKITIEGAPKIEYDGVVYQLGAGGIHSEDKGFTVTSGEFTSIREADVISYYPKIMIENKIKPIHLGEDFLEILTDLIKIRVEAKAKGDKVTSDIFKIVINSIFGKLNSKYSWLEDAEALLKVTINGQLYLLMLIEYLTLSDIKVISANTDGVVAIVPAEKEGTYSILCEAWEDVTKMKLEYTNYKLYTRANVNNYLAITTDDKVKTKGDFNPDIYKDVSKGYDAPIIPKSIYEYFVNGISVEDTIKNSKDILDFCKAPKADKKFEVLYITYDESGNHHIEKLQKTNRYFISLAGGQLVKKEPSKTNHHSFESKKLVTILNDLTPFNYDIKDFKIDYQYYILQANKIINGTKSDLQLTIW